MVKFLGSNLFYFLRYEGILKAMPYKFLIKCANPIGNVCCSTANNNCAHSICKYAVSIRAALTLHVKERYDGLLIARIENAVSVVVFPMAF